MKAKDLSNWEYDSSLEMLLFFAQRMDELLFHHSIDTYRYPVLSILSLCDEYIQVYEDVQNGILNEKNLNHIMEEFVYRLSEDSVAVNILSNEYKNRFVKNWGNWNSQEKFENVLFVRRKLGGKNYYNSVVELLKSNIAQNKEKRLVDRYAGIFIRLLLDAGYGENYIYNSLHDVFFYHSVKNVDSFDSFIKKFTFRKKYYTVYVGFSHDLSRLLPLFEKVTTDEIEITNINLKSLPLGVKAKGSKTILKFEKIRGLDVFSAYDAVIKISSVIVNSYAYYSHIKDKIKQRGQVVDESGKIININKHILLKYRVSALSDEKAQNNADKMLMVMFNSFHNLQEMSKITEIHNSAICSENTSDSLLSLWSIIETLSDGEEGDKIQKVKKCLLPFLKCTYIEKIVSTCMMDIRRWNKTFFETNIREKNPEMSEIEATFAFLVLEEMEEYRKRLYAETDFFPLLRYRVYFLNAQLCNTKGYCALLDMHQQRVEWQLHRIYRARNYIIHDGRRISDKNRELVINLHSYVDLMFNKVIELLKASHYVRDKVRDVIIEQKLKTIIMDEMLNGKTKEKITRDMLKMYLYYDFENNR